MRQIARDVYVEDQYAGVTLAVINLKGGLLQIDAPPSPEDVRSWRAALVGMGTSPERILVNLDAHPDRTLGARAMDCTVLAQETVLQVFRSRSNTFKAQGDETGAEWETIGGIGNVRWAPPEITFDQQMGIHWGDEPVIIEHHPGPSAGAAWVILPKSEVVFVGDTVIKNQPPYLETADLAEWIETVKLLMSPSYRGFTVVSGRSGVVSPEIIRAQKEHLEQALKKYEKVVARKPGVESMESLVAPLLAVFKGPANRQKQFTHRLRYGLTQYYLHHTHPGGGRDE